MTRVLVTRPEPGAGATADRLQALGFEPVMLPLTEIRALPIEAIPSVEGIDAVAITSANALLHAPPELIAAFRDKRTFVVGGGTGAAAQKAGFTDIVVGTGDAAGMARIMLEQFQQKWEPVLRPELRGSGALPAGSRVLHLCGRVRVGGLEQELTRAGIAIIELEIYDAPIIPYTPEMIVSKLDGEGLDAVLLHSAKAASRLAQLVAWPQTAGLFSNASYFCLASRIGAALTGVSQERIFCAPAPEEAELMALLHGRLDTTPVFGRG